MPRAVLKRRGGAVRLGYTGRSLKARDCFDGRERQIWGARFPFRGR